MITTEVGYLDDLVEVNESEPSTVAELVELFGEELIVNETVSNLRYRSKHPRVYRKVSVEVAKTFPRAVVREEEKKDGTKKQIFESHLDHLRKARKKHSTLVDETFARIAPTEPLYVKPERTGAGRISAGAINNANNFFAEGTEKVEDVVKAIEEAVPNFKVGRDDDGEVTLESLARGLQALGQHAARQAEKQALASVGASKE